MILLILIIKQTSFLGPNSKINCVELFSGSSGSGSSSARILAALGSSTIRGYNKKGKQFFCLELNNLTEPIKLFKMRWPDEIFVVGQYIYNSYLINSESINASSSSSNFSLSTSKSSSAFNSVVKSRHYYVCPEKINDMIMLEDRFNRKTSKNRAIFLFLSNNCNIIFSSRPCVPRPSSSSSQRLHMLL